MRQFSSNQIPNLNGVLFWRRDLARWNHLNLSFFLIKSKLHSHCLQLWWKFQHLIHGNIAFEQQPNISYLRPWFLRRVLDHLKSTMLFHLHLFSGKSNGFCHEIKIFPKRTHNRKKRNAVLGSALKKIVAATLKVGCNCNCAFYNVCHVLDHPCVSRLMKHLLCPDSRRFRNSTFKLYDLHALYSYFM